MREIKFRAWNKKDNKMINVEELKWLSYWQSPHELRGHYILNGQNNYSFLIQKEFELMQFILMKDKNEIDIYEGDILRVEIGNHNSWNTFQNEVVEWKGLTLHPFELKHRASVEVIGNIYENLELIK
jgi:uncharacterized phage protein (TIGR01671 family)